MIESETESVRFFHEIIKLTTSDYDFDAKQNRCNGLYKTVDAFLGQRCYGHQKQGVGEMIYGIHFCCISFLISC